MPDLGCSKNSWIVLTMSAAVLMSAVLGLRFAAGGQAAAAPLARAHRHWIMADVGGGGAAAVYPRLIQPIFIQNCVMCHGVHRQKGHLRLDTYANVMYGKYGHKVVLPGDAAHSALIRRILLPRWNHHRMPPHGHGNLTSAQITLLKWWVQSGCSAAGTLDSLHATRAIRQAASAELRIARMFIPQPLSRIYAEIHRISKQTGIAIRALRRGLPWLACDASRDHRFNNGDIATLSHIGANIVTLNLSHTAVTNRGISGLSVMVNLMYLHLEHTAVTNAGLAAISNLGHLRYLNVTGTRVTQAGVNEFKRRNHLWRLWVVGLR